MHPTLISILTLAATLENIKTRSHICILLKLHVFSLHNNKILEIIKVGKSNNSK